MRHFLILSPLAVLMLSSCDPDERNFGAGNDNHQSRNEKKPSTNGIGHEQLAAQDSVGKPPPPRNLAGGVHDTCPVHHEKMRLREIPIVFEDSASAGSEPESPPATAEFPFGAEKIVSSGNALLPDESLSARVYQCASCVAARRAAEIRRAESAPPTASK